MNISEPEPNKRTVRQLIDALTAYVTALNYLCDERTRERDEVHAELAIIKNRYEVCKQQLNDIRDNARRQQLRTRLNVSEQVLEKVRADRSVLIGQLKSARSTIDQYNDLIAELRAVHAPRGPWCSECDYDDGTLTDGNCPHMLRYCRVCWRNEDKREKWPCRTIAAIDAVQSLLTNQTQSTAFNDWVDDHAISTAETLKRFNELDPTTIINPSSSEGNRDD